MCSDHFKACCCWVFDCLGPQHSTSFHGALFSWMKCCMFSYWSRLGVKPKFSEGQSNFFTVLSLIRPAIVKGYKKCVITAAVAQVGCLLTVNMLHTWSRVELRTYISGSAEEEKNTQWETELSSIFDHDRLQSFWSNTEKCYSSILIPCDLIRFN